MNNYLKTSKGGAWLRLVASKSGPKTFEVLGSRPFCPCSRPPLMMSTVLDWSKRSKAHLLRSNTIQVQIPHLTNITRNTPLPREGGARSKRDQFKRTATSLHTFLRISLRRLHFQRFCNRQTHVCHYNDSAATHLYI